MILPENVLAALDSMSLVVGGPMYETNRHLWNQIYEVRVAVFREYELRTAYELSGLGDNEFAQQQREARRSKRWPLIQLYRRFGARPAGLYDAIRKGVAEYEKNKADEPSSV